VGPADTARLTFGTWDEDQQAHAVTLWTDPRVTRFITTGEPPTRADAVARLLAQLDLASAHGVQYWPVFHRESGDLIGCCGLRPRDPATGVWELGVHIRSSLWGRGYATEACREAIRFAFEEFGATALFAGHHPDNTASQRLLERLGFSRTHEEFYPPTGRRHPSYLLKP
jgi:RimJ/RimL family protein N-acetyltransferase